MFETRFTEILKLLQTTMGNHVAGRAAHADLLGLVWNRLGRTMRLFTRLVLLWRAGMLPPPAPSRPGRARKPAPPKPVRIPRNSTWLFALSRLPTVTAAEGIRIWMRDEELRRFLADCPRAARLLRPLCKMLCMSAAEVELAPIRLPPRPRKPRPPKPPREPRRPRHHTRAQIAAMTPEALEAHYGRLPPHFRLPIPNLALIRKKIANG